MGRVVGFYRNKGKIRPISAKSQLRYNRYVGKPSKAKLLSSKVVIDLGFRTGLEVNNPNGSGKRVLDLGDHEGLFVNQLPPQRREVISRKEYEDNQNKISSSTNSLYERWHRQYLIDKMAGVHRTPLSKLALQKYINSREAAFEMNGGTKTGFEIG